MIRLLLFPIIKKYRKLIISMIAVSSLGIALMVGLGGAYDTLDYSLAKYVDDYRYADAVITCDLTSSSVIDDIKRLYGVDSVNARIAGDVPVKTENGRYMTVRAFSYGIRDFQRFYTWEICESDEHPNIAIDKKFADKNSIHSGDTLEVKIDGEFETVTVGRIVSSAECLAIQKDIYSWGENSDFGFLFAPEELAFSSELEGKADQFLLRFKDGCNRESVLSEAEKLIEKSDSDCEIKDSFLYGDSAVAKKIEINLQPLETLSILVPALFFICMIAVVSLFLAQIIRQCRKEIGILRALGFERWRIRLLFLSVTFIITLIASALGIFIGYFLMKTAGQMYGDFFPLPHLFLTLDRDLCIISVIVTVLSGQLSAFAGTAMISKIEPSEAMSREAPAADSTPAWARKFLSHTSPKVKFSITSIFRNKKRFIFSVICVAASVTLILSSIAFNESKDSILLHLYDDRTHYSCQIFFTEEPTDEIMGTLGETKGVSSPEVFSYYTADLEKDGKTESILVCSLSPDSEHITVYGVDNDIIAVPDDGIVLEKHTADALGIKVGDKVDICGKSITVKMLSDQSIARNSYISPKTAKALGDADQYTVLCDSDDQNLLLDTLSEIDTYSHTNFTDIMREGNEETFKTYSLGVNILIGFATLLGVIIVYNTMQTNLFEQKKELSVMRAIGFQITEISNIWLLQSGLQFILSCIIGLPLGTYIAKYALETMATEGREYPLADSPRQFIITAALVLCYIVVSHYAAMLSIRKWDISENTKEKD